VKLLAFSEIKTYIMNIFLFPVEASKDKKYHSNLVSFQQKQQIAPYQKPLTSIFHVTALEKVSSFVMIPNMSCV
jgi:hypothetical protein